MRVLVVDDDLAYGIELKKLLSKFYVVDVAETGEQGLFMCQTGQYGCVLLDISLPDINGTEVCTMLRASDYKGGIIMLTAKYDEGYKVSSLDAGADDYVSKPFKIAELFSRINAVLRRSPNFVNYIKVETGLLTLDDASYSVTKLGNKLDLRKKEYEILKYLVLHEDKVVTREVLLESIWQEGIEAFSNTVDVHIRCLRKKVDVPFNTDTIKTIRGIGYIYSEGGDKNARTHAKSAK